MPTYRPTPSKTALVVAVALALLVFVPAPEARGDDGAEQTEVGIAVHGGVGLPALVHADIGYYVTPRVAVEARYANVIFNSMVGAGVTGHLLGQTGARLPRGHTLLLGGSVLVNPTLGGLRLESGGEVLGAALEVDGGWSWLADSGFSTRARAGGMFYADDGFAATISVRVAVGWVF